ncbi:hypothetical protein AAC387_Pa08g0552 [Persea americana]
MLLRHHLKPRSPITKTLPWISRLHSTAVDRIPSPSHPSLSTVHSKEDLLKSYTVTPPIKPWPIRLSPKRLASMLRRQQNLDLALQIFHHAGNFHPNFSHNFETYQAMIERLSRARAFAPMESLLSDLRRSGVRAGENLFITVIRNYGFANRPKCALRTFLLIRDFGVSTSVRSFNTLLNAMIQCKQLNSVYLLFKNCRKRFGIIPNVFTCNILIKALCKKGDIDAAFWVLDEMPSLGMVPNVVTYTTILTGLCAGGDMEGARRVFDEILDGGWVPDAMSYTILIDGYCKKGRLMDGIKVMDDMEENGVSPNDVTFSVVIEAYCKEKKAGEALSLLDDMLGKKFIPSSGLACRVIDVLCEEGKVDDAYNIWRKLLKNNCTPDNAISSTLIYWLCREGKVLEARKLFDEFERGSIPSVLTYNALISGMCEYGELQETGRLWDDMIEKGCVPNVFTYNMLVKGFCKAGKAKEGVKILEEMLEKGCAPNKFTYMILVDGLCEQGMEEEVMNVLVTSTSSRGVYMDVDSWCVFLTKFVNDFDRWKIVLDEILENKQYEDCKVITYKFCLLLRISFLHVDFREGPSFPTCASTNDIRFICSVQSLCPESPVVGKGLLLVTSQRVPSRMRSTLNIPILEYHELNSVSLGVGTGLVAMSRRISNGMSTT